MGLSVLQVAYPFATLGRGAVGGAEQILTSLARALSLAGHRVVVVACAGSEVSGELVSVGDMPARIDEHERARRHALVRSVLGCVLRGEPIDLVHFHGVDFHYYLPEEAGCPLLATLHLPPSFYPAELFSRPRRDVSLLCVSRSQQASCPNQGSLLPPIPNGVALDDLLPSSTKDASVLALGRICPEKGYHLALEAARLAGVEMTLAGQVFPYEAHVTYFEEQIRPRLDDRRRFVGPAAPDLRRRLLARARCLLVPSLVPETSCLVAMEALACGTPVVAFATGALPEIVVQGRTGYLVEDVRGMADAIGRVGAIDPLECRAAAERAFSDRLMHARYIELYHRLVRRKHRDAM